MAMHYLLSSENAVEHQYFIHMYGDALLTVIKECCAASILYIHIYGDALLTVIKECCAA
jgi:hypothetical protein